MTKLTRRYATQLAAELFRDTAYLSADPRSRRSDNGGVRRRYVMRVLSGSIRSARFTVDVLGSGADWEDAILSALQVLSREAKTRGERFDPEAALRSACVALEGRSRG
jgi:hypothetical protein